MTIDQDLRDDLAEIAPFEVYVTDPIGAQTSTVLSTNDLDRAITEYQAACKRVGMGCDAPYDVAVEMLEHGKHERMNGRRPFAGINTEKARDLPPGT